MTDDPSRPVPPLAVADDRAAVVDLLGALAYAQLSGFEALARDAELTPHVAGKLVFARLAVEMFQRCEQVGEQLGLLGVRHDAAMAPFAGPIDAFHERTQPSDWLEGAVKAYVGDGVVRDFYLEMAQHIDPSGREFIVGMLSGAARSESIVTLVRDELAGDDRRSARLSLWARRIMGEAMQAMQTVAVERDSLTALLVGGTHGTDIAEFGRMTARITVAHTQRMTAIGLSA